MLKVIQKKYSKYIAHPWVSNYIHYSALKDYLIDLINYWYEILWYDGIIIDEQWTLWPISLIFDFSRANYSFNEKNNLAIKNIDEILKKTKEEGYNLDNLYVDVVFRKVKQ